jgi:hypothetical protein
MRGIILVIAAVLLLGCVQAGVPEEEREQTIEVTMDEEPEEITEAEMPEEVPEEEEEEPSAVEALRQKEYNVKTTDGWEIYFTIYYSKEEHDVTAPDTAVVLLHQLGSDRSSYDGLVPLIHEALPTADVIAVDWRGHGKSTNKGSYLSFQPGDYRVAKKDLEKIEDKLSVLRPSIKKYYLVGASIGSSIALDYGDENANVAKVVMISPGIAYHEFDITEDAESYLHDLYITVASDDHYSMNSAGEIYGLCPSDNKELMTYYGKSEHGTALLDATENDEEPLKEVITGWLKE